MRIRSLLMILAGFSFAFGFSTALTPRTFTIALFVIWLLVCLAAVVYADRRLRAWPVLAPAFVLVIAVDAAIVGGYLPYELEIGDLSVAKYGTDDIPGKTLLFVSLILSSGMAAVVGLFVGPSPQSFCGR